MTTRTVHLSLPLNRPATGAPVITGPATVGQELAVDVTGIEDEDGLHDIEYTYQWVRVDADGTSNEEDITDATAATYTLTDDDLGKKVKIEVSFADDFGSDEQRTSAPTDTVTAVAMTTPGVTVSTTALTVTEEDTTGDSYTVVLDSQPTANVTVTVAGHAGTDVTPSPTSLTFTTTTWGTAQTVTVTAGDDADTANDAVTLTHSAASTDTGYEGISIDGVAVTVNDNDTAPATGAPTITGTAQVGQTLTAVTTGIMDADGLTSPTYTYQWIRVDGTDEADIASANSSTYILVDADLGTTLKVRVTFADDLGHTETLTSAATATVGAVATGPPTVTEVAVTSTPASGTTYYLADEVIEFTVTFSAPVTVTATPKFAFRLGAATRQAAYESGSDSAALVFARTVQAGEVDRNGISWNAIALALDGGTITQTGATTAASLTHAEQANLEGHRVDAAPPMQVSASVQGLSLVLVYDEPLDPASMPATGAYTVTATVGATTTNPAVSEVSIYGIWVTLALDAAPAAGATVTLAYAPPASNPVQDEAGNDAPAFSGQSVRLGPPPPDLAQVMGVGVVPGNAQLVVTWTAVDNATGYTVQWKSGGQAYNTGDRQATVTSGSTTSHTITGLANGTEYTVQVSATRTGANDGPPSDEMTGTPTVPTAAGIAVSTAALTVTEQDSTGDGYTVVLDTEPTADVVVTVAGHVGTDVTANPTALTFTMSNWETAQTVTVTADDDADTTDDSVALTHSAASADSGYSGIAIAGVAVTVNDNDTAQVTGVGVVPGNAQLVVTWTAVDNATGYTVQWTSGGQGYNSGDRQATVTSGTTTSHTITGLANGTEYTVQVSATRTGANDGPPSDEMTGTPFTTPPPPPVTDLEQVLGVSVTPGNAQLVVTWTAVDNATGYTVQWKSGGQGYNTGDRQATVTGYDHESHDHGPRQRHRIHGAGERDPDRRQRRPALGRDDGDADGTDRSGHRGVDGGADGDGAGLDRGRLHGGAGYRADGGCRGDGGRARGHGRDREPDRPDLHDVELGNGADGDGDRGRRCGHHGRFGRADPQRGERGQRLQRHRDRRRGGDGERQRHRAGAGGGGRPGQRAAGGDLDGSGQRHGLHGAVDVGQPGLQHRRPAGHGHVGVDHESHDHGPRQRHRIHGAGERDPDRRQRRPALGRDDGDALHHAPAAAAAGDGPCAGAGGGGRPGQRAAGGDLDGSGQRHGLHGAVDVGRPGLQHRRPAGHGHFGVDHESHDHGPRQRHRIHGAGERDPDRRQRRPALGRDDGDADGTDRSGHRGVDGGADGDGAGLDRGRLHGGAGYRADGGCRGDGGRARGHGRDREPDHPDLHDVELGNGADGDGDRGRRCGHHGRFGRADPQRGERGQRLQRHRDRRRGGDGERQRHRAGDGGGGRPGQRAAGGDLDGSGQRHGLHGAVDVGQPGYNTGDRQATVTSGSTTSHTITGLANGTEYTVQVSATRTGANDGPPSDEMTGTPFTTPPPPPPPVTDLAQVLGVGVAPGNAQLVVTWTAVDTATGYTVQWKSGGQGYNTGDRQATVTSGTTTSHTITGLANGTEYTVQVSATRTGANDGPPSDEMTGTPTVPTAAGIAVSTAALTVTEQDSTGDGYTVVLDTEPTADVVVTVAGHVGTDVTANPTALTFTMSNWETAQTVTVTADDDADTTDDSVALTHSAASADSGYSGIAIAGVAVTVNDNDTAQVMGVGVAPGNAQLVVTWTAVDNATGYTVQWTSGGQGYNTGDRQATVTSGSTTSHTITGLANGTEYTVQVSATRTGANDGPPSDEMTGTPFTTPPPPPPP